MTIVGFLFLFSWPFAYIDDSSLTSSPHCNSLQSWADVRAAEKRGEEESKAVSILLPFFKAIPSCMTSMGLPPLEIDIAEWKCSSLLRAASWAHGRVVHLQWHGAYGFCMDRRDVPMGNTLLTILFRKATVSKHQAHRDISVLWHPLKHQCCNTVHCLALFNNLLYNLEDLVATVQLSEIKHLYI